MTKEDLISTFLYIVMVAAIVLVGFFVLRPAMESGIISKDFGGSFLFLVVSIVIAIVLNVVLFELAHILGAKIGGYTIVSTNILGFYFYKKIADGKKKFGFRFKLFSGLTGETLIQPKSKKSNPMFYVFMPLILILIEVAAVYFVWIMIPDPSKVVATIEFKYLLKYTLIVVMTIGACIAFYNYFPAKLDSINDGYRLILLSKKANIEAYNLQLERRAKLYFGEELDKINEFTEITDFTASLNDEIAMQNFLDGDIENALRIIDYTLTEGDKKISKSTKRALNLDKNFILFATKDLEEASEFYKNLDDETRLAVSKCKSARAIRTYILYIGLVEKSDSEIKFALARKKSAFDRLTEGERKIEEILCQKALDKVETEIPGLGKK